jgi:SpoVK/Ycf46/Vps4 family AAA+-type ATPase
MKRITLSDVGGQTKVKREIKLAIIYPIERPDLYEIYKRGVRSSVLLYGPPGCGKTHIARAVAGEVDANFFNIKITDLLSKWHGETDKNIQNTFREARKMAPSILFFDEIDGICGSKGFGGEQFENRILNAFLAEMDGFEDRGDIIVLAATNTPWNIDPALMRPGRFDRLIFVSPPDFDARVEIFNISLRGRPVSGDVDVKTLAELTDGYSGADIKEICDGATNIPLEEAVEGKTTRSMNMSDFMNVIGKTKSSLGYWFETARNRILGRAEEELFGDLIDLIKKYEEGSKKEPFGYV